MLKFLKGVKRAFWCGALLVLVVPLVFLSVQKYNTPLTWEELMEDPPISDGGPGYSERAIKKSRQSAVKVESGNDACCGGSSTTTGTYFIANYNHYVITTYHGIQGPCWLLSVSHKGVNSTCKRYVILDKLNDYAIIELDTPMINRKPIHIPRDLPRGAQWTNSYSILNKIIYTGYPNAVGPLTLRGDVVGYTTDDQIYIFSHAYGGASGSGVFTHSGKYIGYVTAIDIGTTEFGVDILENIVLVAPAFNVDWNIVIE